MINTSGRMKGGNDYYIPFIELGLSSERSNSLLRAQENLGGKFAQATDNPGMEDCYLSFQIGKEGRPQFLQVEDPYYPGVCI